MVDSFAQRLRAALPPEVGAVVTADHGMVDIATDHRIDVDDEPRAAATGSSLLGGEARFRHLYCDAGAVDDVAAPLGRRLGDDGVVVTRDEAIEAGWFGPVAVRGPAAARRRRGRQRR